MTMAEQTDGRFTLTDEFEGSPATSSKLVSGQTVRDSLELEADQTSGQESEQEDDVDGLGDGMDADELKIVKPLTSEALAAFQVAQEKAGIIYISRIPPGMQPTKVRHLMSQYGEVGRIYLQKEGEYMRPRPSLKLMHLQMRNVLICVANTPPLRNHTIPKVGLNSKRKKLLDLSREC